MCRSTLEVPGPTGTSASLGPSVEAELRNNRSARGCAGLLAAATAARRGLPASRRRAAPVALRSGGEPAPAVKKYLLFILLSTAIRSFEAGIIASMMPSIKESLRLSYAEQGNVAGSPDYGIVPSGVIAMAIFSRVRAHTLLTAGYFIIGAVCLVGALFPSQPTLICARAIGGLFWGFAAVHYPAWVNAYGPADRKTIWMAMINAMLLAGIVSGYVIGGAARATGTATWEVLYMLEGLLMIGCGICGGLFAPELVEVKKKVVDNTSSEDTGPAPAAEPRKSASWTSVVPKEFVALCRSRLFVFTVTAGSFQSGVVGFMLYFITQAIAANFGWGPSKIYAIVSAMIAVGPISGILIGAKYLNSVGGYGNYARAHQLTAGCALLALLCSLCLPVARSSAWLYGAASLGLLLLGAAPTAAINGIAVSAVPNASHFASGAQFAAQNLAKLIVPAFGGAVIDCVGLIRGYNLVTIGVIALYALAAWLAYQEALRHKGYQEA